MDEDKSHIVTSIRAAKWCIQEGQNVEALIELTKHENSLLKTVSKLKRKERLQRIQYIRKEENMTRENVDLKKKVTLLQAELQATKEECTALRQKFETLEGSFTSFFEEDLGEDIESTNNTEDPKEKSYTEGEIHKRKNQDKDNLRHCDSLT